MNSMVTYGLRFALVLGGSCLLVGLSPKLDSADAREVSIHVIDALREFVFNQMDEN